MSSVTLSFSSHCSLQSFLSAGLSSIIRYNRYFIQPRHWNKRSVTLLTTMNLTEIRRRAGDHPQDLAGRRLPVERLVALPP